MEQISTEKENPVEESVAVKERNLWIASEQYMLGNISATKLEEIELPFTLDLKKALLSIAKEQVKRQSSQAHVLDKIREWLKQTIQIFHIANPA